MRPYRKACQSKREFRTVKYQNLPRETTAYTNLNKIQAGLNVSAPSTSIGAHFPTWLLSPFLAVGWGKLTAAPPQASLTTQLRFLEITPT